MSAAPNAATVAVGAKLPEIASGRISRHRIAQYAAGSGDLNAIHVDADFARKAGLDDVIVHGMYSMGLLGRVVAEWAGPEAVVSIETRFEAMLKPLEEVRCTGEVVALEGPLATVALLAARPDGVRIASGSAVVRLPVG